MADHGVQPLPESLTRPSGDRQRDDEQRQTHKEKPALAETIGGQRQRRAYEDQRELQTKLDQSPPFLRFDSRNSRTPSR
jgi:hypothetical protein